LRNCTTDAAVLIDHGHVVQFVMFVSLAVDGKQLAVLV